MSTIPCKYLKKGKDECPFSSSCFYLHLDRNGKPINYSNYEEKTLKKSKF